MYLFNTIVINLAPLLLFYITTAGRIDQELYMLATTFGKCEKGNKRRREMREEEGKEREMQEGMRGGE